MNKAAQALGRLAKGMKLSTQLHTWQGERTDAQAAAALGVNLRNYHNWKAGHRTPRGLAMETLLNLLKKTKRS